ncbi:MAG: YkgJ family cysteine cluster protein [Candidatus Omnitrophota bacterium]
MQFKELKQIVPKEICSKCEVCCRFSEQNSVFAPHLLEADLKMLFEAGLSQEIIEGFRFKLREENSLYLCPCFKKEKNRCKFYSERPLECRLYPFLLARKNDKIFLAMDSKCPWVNEQIIKKNTKYIKYLKEFLERKPIIEIISENKSFIGDYTKDDAVEYLEELKIADARN